VEIKLSRHAKRRAKLYKIPESTILRILEGRDFNQGNQEIIENVEGFKYPLKIVIVVENDIITVETNYPLKKGRKG
jgi:predicted transcriptional regulator